MPDAELLVFLPLGRAPKPGELYIGEYNQITKRPLSPVDDFGDVYADASAVVPVEDYLKNATQRIYAAVRDVVAVGGLGFDLEEKIMNALLPPPPEPDVPGNFEMNCALEWERDQAATGKVGETSAQYVLRLARHIAKHARAAEGK